MDEELNFWENSEKKKLSGDVGRGSGGGLVGGGGQGRYVRRIEVFVKIQKKMRGGGRGEGLGRG